MTGSVDENAMTSATERTDPAGESYLADELFELARDKTKESRASPSVPMRPTT